MCAQYQYSESGSSDIRSKCAEPDYYLDEEYVEFHLTYEGQLLGASRTDTRAKHKHEIRKAFHPQLKRLWEKTHHLKQMRDPLPTSPIMVQGGSFRRREEALPDKFKCGPFRFVPLVTRDLALTCSLDILFLRPEPRGSIIVSGDIDNRIKTLFDALRMPGPSTDELAGYEPAADEDPLYCLAENDNLITRIAVDTDMLLSPVGSEGFRNNDARLFISVKVRPTNASWGSLDFL